MTAMAETNMTAEVTNPQYLIWKQGAYYRPNSQGYTTSAIQAGRYTLDEAERITHPNGPEGPRDGMRYVHEDEVIDADWQAYQALRAQLAEARALPAAQVGVRPLGWVEYHTDRFYALGVNCEYKVHLNRDGSAKWQYKHMGNWQDARSLQDAKDLVQAHCNTSIDEWLIGGKA